MFGMFPSNMHTLFLRDIRIIRFQNLLAQVLDTKKGRGLLVQEAKILKALRLES